MGTPTGMLIYSLEDPLVPKYRSSVSHVFGCDPVVVEDDLAYVTVHSGNTCPGSSFFKEEVNHLIRLHFAREKETIDEAISRLAKLQELLS